MKKSIELLLCYRGRFKNYVSALAEELRRRGLRVTYDREILADGSAYDENTQVDWFSLGDTPQKDTGWRAPLHEAIASAEMVAFALDIRDQSENVINEIRWTIQCDAHTFFLIHEGPQNLESQGIIIGTLATNYLLTAAYDLATKTRNALPDDPKPAELLRPEYPEFGYHFCGNLDRDNLQKDVLIAANRMVAHLERCRKGKLRELTADNDVTMSELEQTPLVLGRKLLSRLQEAMLRGWIEDSAGPRKPAFDAAKEYWSSRRWMPREGLHRIANSITSAGPKRFWSAAGRAPTKSPATWARSPYRQPPSRRSFMAPFARCARNMIFGPPSLSARSSIRTLLSLGSSFPPTAARSSSRMQTLLTFYIS